MLTIKPLAGGRLGQMLAKVMAETGVKLHDLGAEVIATQRPPGTGRPSWAMPLDHKPRNRAERRAKKHRGV